MCLSTKEPASLHRAKERWFGLPGNFVYAACADCGSLALVDPPSLAEYYPSDYYSLVRPSSPTERFVSYVAEEVQVRHVLRLLRRAGDCPKREAAILDVGCGNGRLLNGLHRRGFINLTGVDPFLEEESERAGLRLFKKGIDEVEGRFDLILFNHSLEHIPNVEETLLCARRLLNRDGKMMVRIPVPNYAWRHYGTDWVGLDAPRHLHLMTRAGLTSLATRAGFNLKSCVFDSRPIQFWASEAYKKGRTLESAVPTHVLGLAFHVLMRGRYFPRAAYLNRVGLGDQAAFTFT
jgi:SAM-dependent methyltransferase